MALHVRCLAGYSFQPSEIWSGMPCEPQRSYQQKAASASNVLGLDSSAQKRQPTVDKRALQGSQRRLRMVYQLRVAQRCRRWPAGQSWNRSQRMVVSCLLRARPPYRRMKLSNSFAPGTLPLLLSSNFGLDSCSGMRPMRFPLSGRQLAHHDSVVHPHNVPDCPQESRPAPAAPVPTRQKARIKPTGTPWPSKWPPSF